MNLLFIVYFCLQCDFSGCFGPKYLAFYLYLNLSWLFLHYAVGLDRLEVNSKRKIVFIAYLQSLIFFFFLFLLFFQLTPLSYYPRTFIKVLFPLYFIILIAWKLALYFLVYYSRKQGLHLRQVVILGDSPRTRDLMAYFNANPMHGSKVIGLFGLQTDAKNHSESALLQLMPYLDKGKIDEIYIDMQVVERELILDITRKLYDHAVKVRILPDLGDFSLKNNELVYYGSCPVIQVHAGPLNYWYNRLMKRTIDIILSMAVIAGFLSWFIPVLFLISSRKGFRALFFIQKRTGTDGKVFNCYKFRTMVENPESDSRQASSGDKRITRIGRFLRHTSLDETPQFVNVLLGGMSVVGPRPHMLQHTGSYKQLNERFMLRHYVKPGITGLAQVSGSRGEIRDEESLFRRVEFDVNYVENWSFNLDMKIMLITAWLMIKGQAEAY